MRGPCPLRQVEVEHDQAHDDEHGVGPDAQVGGPVAARAESRSKRTEPSSGGMGTRLNAIRPMLPTLKKKTIWAESDRRVERRVDRGAEDGDEHDGADGGQDGIGGRPGQRHQHALIARAAQPGRVDRHRLGPPEDAERRPGPAGPARSACRPGRCGRSGLRVRRPARFAVSSPKSAGHPAVRDLVQDDGRHDHAEEDDLVAA